MTAREVWVKVEPENVDTGDVIEVVHPAVNGVTKRVRGRVHSRESYALGARTLYTKEGGELYSWYPGRARGALFLISRGEIAPEPEPLFDLREF